MAVVVEIRLNGTTWVGDKLAAGEVSGRWLVAVV